MKTRLNIVTLFTGLLLAGLLNTSAIKAQQFLNHGTIEFEVKTNMQKTMGSGSWDEMLKSAMSQFKTGYYVFSFSGDKSIYKFDHWDPQQKIPEWFRRNDEDNIWYMDHGSNQFFMKKSVFGAEFLTQDSIPQSAGKSAMKAARLPDSTAGKPWVRSATACMYLPFIPMKY